jgi:hypothetical protein
MLTMKITTPKGYIIELTAEEAEALFPELVRDVRRQLGGAGEGGHELTPQRLVRRVLRRHRIPPTQRAVYRALYEADDDGLDFVSLAAAVGRSVEELSGVLGGLGRRVNATPGVGALAEPPGVTLFFEKKPSAPPGGGWGWAMRPETRVALEEMGLPWEE